MHPVPAGGDAHAGRVRIRQSRCRSALRRRGAGLPRGPERRPLRRAGRKAARQAARRHRPGALRHLRGERVEMPPSPEPRSAAGGDRILRAAPLPPDRADPAEARGDPRELRHQAPLRQARRDHARARSGAAGDARRQRRRPVPALPPCRRPVHAVDAQGAGGGLRAHPGTDRALGRRDPDRASGRCAHRRALADRWRTRPRPSSSASSDPCWSS